MRPGICVAFLLISALVEGQSLPEAPSASMNVAAAATMKAAATSAPASPVRLGLIKQARPTREPGVLDRRFFLVSSIMLGGLVADDITTRRGLGSGCTESSPLLGPHPSLGRQIAISGAEGAGMLALTYFFKKLTRNDEPGVARNIWMIFPIIDGSVHVFAATWNAGKKCR
jgi:hypothetical protein